MLLQLGELLHGEDFSLFEAMSAVEIGDPKLDAGLTVDYSQPTDRCAPLAKQRVGRALPRSSCLHMGRAGRPDAW